MNHSAVSDQMLLQQWAQRHDAEAFNELTARYAGMVYATCRRVLRNEQDAEEVAQECFMRLASDVPAIHSSLGGWLHRFATCRSIDRLRSMRRREDREKSYMKENSQKVEIHWTDLSDHIDSAIAELPENLQGPIIAHFLERKTHDAIATELGVSRQAVSQRIKKGVSQLRGVLSKKGIAVSAAALVGLLEANCVEAAPMTLLAALGKVAVAGFQGTILVGAQAAGSSVVSESTTAAGLMVLVQKLLVAASICVLAGGVFYGVRAALGPDDNLPDERIVPVAQAEGASEAPTTPETRAVDTEEVLLSREDAAQFKALLAAYLKSRQEEATESESDAANGGSQGFNLLLAATKQTPNIDPADLFSRWEALLRGDVDDDPELRAMLAQYENAFQLLRRGLSFGDVTMPPSGGLWRSGHYLNGFKYLAQVMAVKAQLQALDGASRDALDTFNTLIDFSIVSTRGGGAINGVIGYTMTGMAAETLAQSLPLLKQDEEVYAMTVQNLRRLDQQVVASVDVAAAEAQNFETWVDRQLTDLPELREMLRSEAEDSSLYNTIDRMSDDQLSAMFRDASSNIENLYGYFSQSYPDAQASDPSDFATLTPVSDLYLSGMSRVQEREAHAHAAVRGAMVAAAIEAYRARYSSPPAALDALVPTYLPEVPEDPYTGAPIQYRPTPTGYVVYSTGPDRVDDGGNPGGSSDDYVVYTAAGS